MSERFWTEEEVERILGAGAPAEISRKMDGTAVGAMNGQVWPCGCMGFRLFKNEWEITSCGLPDHEVKL